MSSDDDAMSSTERFSNRVDDYDKYRPSYPKGVLDVLSREAHLKPSAVIADVGSGTGILTELLLDHGNTVYAVEPNAPMRQAAERRLISRKNFKSVAGTAEATTLKDKSVDAIIAAQAFHWFDHGKALAEFKRIAKPASFVALIWNARIPTSSALNTDYEHVVHTYGTEFARSGSELVPTMHIRKLLGPSTKLFTLHNEQVMDWPALRGRLQSASYMPTPGQPRFDEMIAALRQAFDAHQQNGIVKLLYETRVYLADL
jgi:ubiquinone/menaquinone biosynthesis C-methylase UbiE